MLELIEWLDEDGLYARFLAERGGGVHHIAVAIPDCDETLAKAERKDGLILSGEFSGTKVAFLSTERDLGMILEVFSGMPESTPNPDAT